MQLELVMAESSRTLRRANLTIVGAIALDGVRALRRGTTREVFLELDRLGAGCRKYGPATLV